MSSWDKVRDGSIFDLTENIEIPGIIFPGIMSRKITAGHIRDMFRMNSDVPSRVIDVRLHYKDDPRKMDKENINDLEMPHTPISSLTRAMPRSWTQGGFKLAYVLHRLRYCYNVLGRLQVDWKAGFPKQRLVS